MTTNYHESAVQIRGNLTQRGWLSRIGVPVAVLTTVVVNGCAHMKADRELAELLAEPTPWEDADGVPMTDQQQKLLLMSVERSYEFGQEIQELVRTMANRLACTCPDEDERVPLSFEWLSRIPIYIAERSEFAIGDQDVGDGEGATLSSIISVYNDRTGDPYAHVTFTLYWDDEGNFATGTNIEHVDGGAISSQTGFSDTYEFADWDVDSMSASLVLSSVPLECVAVAPFKGLSVSDDIRIRELAVATMDAIRQGLHVHALMPSAVPGHEAISVPYWSADSCAE